MRSSLQIFVRGRGHKKRLTPECFSGVKRKKLHGSTLFARKRCEHDTKVPKCLHITFLPLVTSVTGGPGPVVSRAAREWLRPGVPQNTFSKLCSSLSGAGAAWSPSVPILRGYYITKRALCQEVNFKQGRFGQKYCSRRWRQLEASSFRSIPVR